MIKAFCSSIEDLIRSLNVLSFWDLIFPHNCTVFVQILPEFGEDIFVGFVFLKLQESIIHSVLTACGGGVQ